MIMTDEQQARLASAIEVEGKVNVATKIAHELVDAIEAICLRHDFNLTGMAFSLVDDKGISVKTVKSKGNKMHMFALMESTGSLLKSAKHNLENFENLDKPKDNGSPES